MYYPHISTSTLSGVQSMRKEKKKLFYSFCFLSSFSFSCQIMNYTKFFDNINHAKNEFTCPNKTCNVNYYIVVISLINRVVCELVYIVSLLVFESRIFTNRWSPWISNMCDVETKLSLGNKQGRQMPKWLVSLSRKQVREWRGFKSN